MTAYLLGQEGPYAEAVFALEEGLEWTFGRDPEVNTYALSDPTVSRRHARLFLDDGVYYVENLSTINPLLVNGEEISEAFQLQEDDIVQIGNNTLRFTEHLPQKPKPTPQEDAPELADLLPQLSLRQIDNARWMVKVISGPNAGAEFSIRPGEVFVVGKDPDAADIVLQDLSVSRQHAKMTASNEGVVTIEDLGSKNGVFVNGARVETVQHIESQDLISLGTSSLLLIDREQTRETIYSPAAAIFSSVGREEKVALAVEEEAPLKNWKEILIPTRHLVVASIFSIVILTGLVGVISLFRAQPVEIHVRDETREIANITEDYPTIEFSFNAADGTLFLVGHVLTEVDKSELLYLLKTLPFIQSFDDNIVVDELLWSNLNALIVRNQKWRSILVTAPRPGEFVMRGYLPTMEDVAELTEYVNRNFPHISKLSNEVVIENNLQIEVQNLLITQGFAGVTFQFNNGELVLAGRADADEEKHFLKLMKSLEAIQGVRLIKNFVIFTGESSAQIDLSQNYTVMGTSKYGDVSQYILINGKILSDGDTLDGMRIIGIESNRIHLEKDGMKYKIDFNNQ